MEELFEKHEGEYRKFGRIENPPTQRPDLAAMMYLDKRFPSTVDMVAAAEHDEFYLEVEAESLEEADVIYLIRCGVSLYDGQLKMYA